MTNGLLTFVILFALGGAGGPLNEPIVRFGPFVMNKREEIMEAIADFKNGSMGKITPS
jgi:redox-sensitive bicupin YhaK (pirin superfamily)